MGPGTLDIGAFILVLSPPHPRFISPFGISFASLDQQLVWSDLTPKGNVSFILNIPVFRHQQHESLLQGAFV